MSSVNDDRSTISQPALVSKHERPLPPVPTASEQELVSDFKHLGLSVRANDSDQSNAEERGVSASKPLPRGEGSSPPAESGTDASAQLRRKAVPNGDVSSSSVDVNGPPDIKMESTVDSTIETTVAAPVVHETVRRENREIVQEVITRDIHEYHEVTRIQPVIMREFLPARHFIETEDGRKVEIKAPDPAAGPLDLSKVEIITQSERPSGRVHPTIVADSVVAHDHNVSRVHGRTIERDSGNGKIGTEH